MTLETMQWHEMVTLRHEEDDYRRASLVRLIRPHVRGERVLDLRCLTGRLAVELAAEGRQVMGLDGYGPSVEMANARAKKQGLATPMAHLWELKDLTAHVGGRRFDTVICLDVLNHVPDDEATVREIAGALADGGRLILAAPAFPALLGARDASLGHLRRYTRRSLQALLERYGLAVRAMRYWNFAALPVYVLVERVFRKRLPDRVRYGRDGILGSWPNRVLGWWYAAVENRIAFPLGLTLFVIAEKPLASVMSQKSVTKPQAGPATEPGDPAKLGGRRECRPPRGGRPAAAPHGSARPPGRCTAAGALRAPTGRLRAGVGTPGGATRSPELVSGLLAQGVRHQ